MTHTRYLIKVRFLPLFIKLSQIHLCQWTFSSPMLFCRVLAFLFARSSLFPSLTTLLPFLSINLKTGKMHWFKKCLSPDLIQPYMVKTDKEVFASRCIWHTGNVPPSLRGTQRVLFLQFRTLILAASSFWSQLTLLKWKKEILKRVIYSTSGNCFPFLKSFFYIFPFFYLFNLTYKKIFLKATTFINSHCIILVCMSDKET